MPLIRYSVAASLDGYIAGPQGEFDWIPRDPDIDFAAMYAEYGHLLMGRRSYEVYVGTGGNEGPPLPVTVCSTTLAEGERDGVRFVKDAIDAARALREAGGKPVWLWGGGALFRSLAEAGLVDEVEVALIPVLLGTGVKLLPPPAARLPLRLLSHRLYPKTGIVMLRYAAGG
jgi:dihydrofolate reductase